MHEICHYGAVSASAWNPTYTHMHATIASCLLTWPGCSFQSQASLPGSTQSWNNLLSICINLHAEDKRTHHQAIEVLVACGEEHWTWKSRQENLCLHTAYIYCIHIAACQLLLLKHQRIVSSLASCRCSTRAAHQALELADEAQGLRSSFGSCR